MRLDEEGLHVLLSGTLVAFLVVFTVFLVIDLLTGQREFGAFLTAELVAFALLVYVSTRPNYEFNQEGLGSRRLSRVGLLARTGSSVV